LRILLTSNASYLPPRGGSTRSNIEFLKTLVEQGHQCRVISGAPEALNSDGQNRLRDELQEQQLDASLAARFARDPVVEGNLHGIEIISVRDLLRNTQVLTEQIAAWRPDWVLVSSEDLSHTLLRQASKAAPGRLIYLAHTPQWFPFGPAAWNADREGTAVVRRAAAVVVISEAMQSYVKQHLGLEPALVHPPIYGPGPWPVLSRLDGFIGMVNPCAVKGISTFVALADHLPNRRFAVLPGWGTTQQDAQQLKRRKNISVLPRVRDIDLFLQRLSVLLMPSVWLEGFGLIVMEAMLRGVPVISSDSGGLREAKAGTPFVIHTRLIERYESVYDDRNMPRPVLPSQSIEPWVIALHELTKGREVYDQEVRRAREAALRFVGQIDRSALGRLLGSLPAPPEWPSGKIKPILSQLSEQKRELLLKRLRERAGEKR
jgi:glycosyltransferase involved in cell wall biosynthesis